MIYFSYKYYIQIQQFQTIYKLIQRVSYFDTFGAEVKLNFRKKETHQSPFGGFCTILMVAVLAIVFIQGAISLIKQETFTISSNKVLNIDPPSTILNYNDYMMAFQVENPIINGTKQLIDFTYTQYEQNLNENGTLNKIEKYSLPLEQCTVDHFQDFNQSTVYNVYIIQLIISLYFLSHNSRKYSRTNSMAIIVSHLIINLILKAPINLIRFNMVELLLYFAPLTLAIHLRRFSNSNSRAISIIVLKSTLQCSIEYLIQIYNQIIFPTSIQISIFPPNLDLKPKQMSILKNKL